MQKNDLVLIMLLTPGAVLPKRASELAAGYDLSAALEEELTLPPGAHAHIPTGIALSLPYDMEAQVRPRSGLAFKYGVTVLNAPGTVDADYRGEVGVILINHGETPFIVTPGMRIAQLVFAHVKHPEFELCENLDDTKRGAGGFGHSGT